MKKTLIALAVLGTAAGVAHAQSNVTIYGVMDTGYVYQSGNSWRMGQNQDSKIGFRGVEDLGNGLKATFELERRFDLNDGSIANTGAPTYKGKQKQSGPDWDGAANIGLAGNWGRVRLGRVNELSTETIRKFDPFYQYGVGSMIYSTQRSVRIDNTLRYDSPKWAGFSFGLSYSLGDNTKDNGNLSSATQKANFGKKIDNDGYGINLSYDNYGFVATANWSRLADSNDSSVWNIGVGYKFGPAKVTLLFEKTKDEGYKAGKKQTYANGSIYELNGEYEIGIDGVESISADTMSSDQKLWLLGLEWDVGPGQLDASIQRMNFDNPKIAGKIGVNNGQNYIDYEPYKAKLKDADIMKYAIGYTYNLSKRTSVYGQVAYTDYDNKVAGMHYTGTERDDAWGFQVGMTHKF